MRACAVLVGFAVGAIDQRQLATIPEGPVDAILQGCGIDGEFVLEKSRNYFLKSDLAEAKGILGLLTGRLFKGRIEKSCSHMIVDDDDAAKAATNECCKVLKNLVDVLVKPRNPDDSGPFRSVLGMLEDLAPQSDPGQSALDKTELEGVLASFNKDE